MPACACAPQNTCDPLRLPPPEVPGSSTSSGAGKIIGTSLQNIGKAANNLPLQLAGVGINGERVIHRAVFCCALC